MKVRKLVTIAIMTSIAIVLSIVESFIPTGIPGVKLGLANVVTLVVLYYYSLKEAAFVQFLRVLVVGLVYSGLFSQAFLLSLSGAIVSFLIMLTLYLIKKSSIVTISVISAMGHSIGQILFASFLMKTTSVILYLPLLLTLSIISGLVTGYLAYMVLNIFKIEVLKPRIISTIIASVFLLISITSLVILKSYTKPVSKGSIAVITYNNERIMEISLDDPTRYKELVDNVFVSTTKDNDSYLFTYNIYNKDEKENYDLVVEVVDSKIRIKEETSKKHVCSKMGYIKNRYESLVCLPNNFIITIEDLSLSEIDNIM